MKKQYFRRLKNKLEVGSRRRLQLSFIAKLLSILFVSLITLIGLAYIGTFYGYQQKLIQSVESIPDELKHATVILDEYPENDNLLIGFLDRAYEARKLTSAHIYTLSDKSESEIKAIIKIIPSSKFELKLDPMDLISICKDIATNSVSKKTIVIANPDIAIRTANVCNNLEVYTIPATIEDTDYLIFSIDYSSRLNELIKILLNRLENN